MFSQYVTSGFLSTAVAMILSSDYFFNFRDYFNKRKSCIYKLLKMTDEDRYIASRDMGIVMISELIQLIVFGVFAPLLTVAAAFSFLIKSVVSYY